MFILLVWLRTSFQVGLALKKGDNSREMQEERRNCFVAITRAQETLTLTYSSRTLGCRKRTVPFLFTKWESIET